MKGRTLGLAALAILIGLIGLTDARAQNNLDAGKPPSRLFADTCAVCHKSPRGLLKTVPGSSLPGFLRQHYTTGPDMASALAGYLMSSGAAERVPDPPARAQKNQQAKEQAKEGAEPSAKQKRQRVTPDADGLQAGEISPSAKQKAAKKGKAGKNQVAEPKPEAKPEPKGEPDEKPQAAAQSEPPKTEPEKPAEAVKSAEPASDESPKSGTARTEPSSTAAKPEPSTAAGQGEPKAAPSVTDNPPARADTAPQAPATTPAGRVSRPAGLTLPGFPPPVAEEPTPETPAAKPSAEVVPKNEIPQIEPAKVDIGGSASEQPKSADKSNADVAPAKEQSGDEEVFGRQAPPKAARKKTAAPPQ